MTKLVATRDREEKMLTSPPNSIGKITCAVTAEIIATERSFIHEVRTYLEVLIRPMRLQIKKDPFLTETEATTLECNMEQVFSLSRQILRELEKSSPSLSVANTSAKTVGQIFAEHAEEMRVEYVSFVSKYLPAFTLNARLMKEQRKRKGTTTTFHTYMKDAADRQRSRWKTRQIADFLILPIQRVPRYRLMLIELWKKTAPSLEREWIKEAVLRISAVATEMNRSLFRATSERKVLFEKSKSMRTMKNKLLEEKVDIEEEEAEALNDEGMFEKLESLSQSLYRPRPPTLFSLDVLGDDNDSDDDVDGLVTREEELDRLIMTRGWTTGLTMMMAVASSSSPSLHPPTTNPFVLYHVLTRDNPFLEIFSPPPPAATADNNSKKAPRRVTALTISMKLVRGLYSPLLPAKPFRPQKNDLIVVGPIRSGQTPILHILESLRSGNVVPVTSLLDRVCWLESDEWDNRKGFQQEFRLDEDETVACPPYTTGRLIKTHSSRLNQAFGGVLIPSPRGELDPDFRVIVVLRDPSDLRLSFYRHCRRMYRKLTPVTSSDQEGVPPPNPPLFDDICTLDDFTSSFPFYEAFINDTLKVALDIESAQLHIVFYEELLARPDRVVAKLAAFTRCLHGYSQERQDSLVRNITQEIRVQREYPGMSSSSGVLASNNSRKVGSSYQGKALLAKPSLARLQEMWQNNVSTAYKRFPSYDALYTHMTGGPSMDSKPSGGSGMIQMTTDQLRKTGIEPSAAASSATMSSKREALKEYLVRPLARRLPGKAGSFSMLSSSSFVKAEPLLPDPPPPSNDTPPARPRPGSFVIMSTSSAAAKLRRAAGRENLLRPRQTHLGVETALSRAHQHQLHERLVKTSEGPVTTALHEAASAVTSRDAPSEFSTRTAESNRKSAQQQLHHLSKKNQQKKLDPDDTDEEETIDGEHVSHSHHYNNIVGERM